MIALCILPSPVARAAPTGPRSAAAPNATARGPEPQAETERAIVAQLQAAAIRVAGLEPGRALSLVRRVRGAAALPRLRVRAGRGESGYYRGVDGVERYTSAAADNWHVEVEAQWSLDRLRFDRNEVLASREGQFLAERREEVTATVTQLYFALRRAELGLTTDDEGARALEIDELSALIDGMTDGALARARAGVKVHQ
jgi:hypothetical protein